jgi:hypothetical protein
VQNNEDLSFNVDINYSSDGDVAKLIPSSTFIEPKTYNNKFSFQITIPSNAKPGDKYSLSFSARPLLNQTGEVPMVVEIRRGITINIVDKEGLGYKKTWLDNQLWLKNSIQAAGTAFDVAKIYIAALILIALVYIIVFRIWKISNKISVNISLNNKPSNKSSRHLISESVNLEELKSIVGQLNSQQCDVPEIRKMIANKAEQFDKHLGIKILHADNKKSIMEYLGK